MIIDISPPITSSIAVWPGDVPFSRTVALDLDDGANLTLSAITTTVHVGAHTDAPSHYLKGGDGIGERPLELYFGPCQVIVVDVPRGHRITPDDLPDPVASPRVLFKTGTYPDPNHFNRDFAAFSPELVDHCAALGVRLMGLDTPSVDLCEDEELVSHGAIARHDLAILEGVVLDHVDPGHYMLAAFPLNLPEADASPVRAVLIR